MLFTFSSWLILVLLAKFGDLGESGRYTLALATTAPIFLFFDLNIRVTRSTDHQYNETFENYLGLRFWTVTFAFLVSATLCIYLYSSNYFLFLAVAAFRVGESISTLAYGGFQRMNFSDRIGQSMTFKGVLALTAVCLIVPITGSAEGVAIAMAAISISWSIFWDLPRAWKLSHTDSKLSPLKVARCMTDTSTAMRIAKRSLPLGFDSLVTSLTQNTPRYCIKYFFGDAALGVFGVLSQLAFSIQMIIGSVGHVGVPVLSQHFQNGRRDQFWRLVNRMVLYSLAVGTTALIGGTFVIPFILGKTFAPEFNQPILMSLLLLASCLAGAQRTLGRATQACGAYFWYTTFDVVMFVVSAIFAVLLVPEFKLIGAGAALAIAFTAGLLITIVHTYYFLWKTELPSSTQDVAV